MTDKIFSELAAVLTAVIGLAIIAVLVSKNADTANVVKAGGSSFSSILKAAVSPVAGSNSLSFG